MKKLKFNKTGLIAKKNMSGYLFVAPFIIGILFFFLPSILDSLWYGFNDVKIDFSQITKTFVGIKNFQEALMEDVSFRVILLKAVKGMLLDTLIILIFSFFIANILNQKFIGRGVARMIFFLPVILTTGMVAAAEAGNGIFNAMTSVVGSATEAVDEFDKLGFAGNFSLEHFLMSSGISSSFTSVILYAVQNTYAIINSSGVQILIFISALQAISPSVFEAAKVEGATKWEEFWKITFPMLTPVIFVNIIYSIVDTFTNPVYGVMEYTRGIAFVKGRFGYASAISWLYFAIILFILGVITLVVTKRIHYLD
ncbi:MAG TPA: sugar ABC transporter permease [Mobilitalea sp.]|nr:sugar ABC transporter permease [Mobilitalea sp.]